jgi:hypothetical protein
MSHRGISTFLIALFVLAASVAGGLWYYETKQSGSSPSSTYRTTPLTPPATTVEAVNTSSPETQSPSGSGFTGETSSTVFSSDGQNATYTNYMWGLSVAFDSGDYSPGRSPVAFDADFADQNQPIEVVSFGDNSDTGFAIFVDPTIRTASSCAQFGTLLNRGAIAQETLYRISYSTINYSDASMANTVYTNVLHTFQNSLCYALDVEYLQSNEELYPPETNALEDSFLQGTSFFQPEQTGL